MQRLHVSGSTLVPVGHTLHGVWPGIVATAGCHEPEHVQEQLLCDTPSLATGTPCPVQLHATQLAADVGTAPPTAYCPEGHRQHGPPSCAMKVGHWQVHVPPGCTTTPSAEVPQRATRSHSTQLGNTPVAPTAHAVHDGSYWGGHVEHPVFGS